MTPTASSVSMKYRIKRFGADQLKKSTPTIGTALRAEERTLESSKRHDSLRRTEHCSEPRVLAVSDLQRIGEAQRDKRGANRCRVRMLAGKRDDANPAVGQPVGRVCCIGPLDQRRDETGARQMAIVGDRDPPVEIAALHRMRDAGVDRTS